MDFLDRIKEKSTLLKTLDLNRKVLLVIYGYECAEQVEANKKVLTSSDTICWAKEVQLQQQIDLFAETVSFTLEGFNRYPLLLSQRHHLIVRMNEDGWYILFFNINKIIQS